MIPPSRPWTRRRLLRGAGAVLALPWLEALAPLRAAGPGGAPPVRLACLFMPNGALPRGWWPRDEEPSTPLPTILEPLEPLRDRLLLLRNLCNRNAFEGEGHYVKTTSLLSGARVRKTGGRDVRCGTTVDQVAARHVGRHTLLPSLELGIDPPTSRVDMGYSTLYGSHVSWAAPDRPLPKEIVPRRAFDRLFRRVRSAARPEDPFILDLVLEEARGLRRVVGYEDRHRLDEYLESVRALEERLARAEREPVNPMHLEHLEGLRPPEGIPAFPEHVRLMLEVLVLAFRTDTTRVATFMFGNSVSGRNFSFLDGVEGGFHPYSHHEGREDKMAAYERINRWHVEQLAWFCQRLDAIPEGDGTLLDQSLVLFASGIGDGNAHDPKCLPVALLGRGGGRLPRGQYQVFPKQTPLCGLHLSLLHAMGVPADSFGDASTPLLKLRQT